MRVGGRRIVAGDDLRPRPQPVAKEPGDVAGVLEIGRDRQAAGVGLLLTDRRQPGVGLRHDGRQPLAVEAEGGAQALGDPGRVERVGERRRLDRTVWRGPLHQSVDPGEVDGPHHPAVAQRLAVAVLVVRHRLVEHVAHEGDGRRVAPEGGARQAQPPRGGVEGGAQRGAPGALVAGVVDLVEDHEGVARQTAQLGRRVAGGHLLVGGHHAVHVARQRDARRPRGVERQTEPVGGKCPLLLEVGGRRHHDEARWSGAGATRRSHLAERDAGRGEGEGRLAGARRGDGQEVGRGAGREPIEGRALPGTKTKGRRHGGRSVSRFAAGEASPGPSVHLVVGRLSR